MTKNDYLRTWGQLEVLKSIYEEKARMYAKNDSNLASDYLKWAAEVAELQEKIDKEANK